MWPERLDDLGQARRVELPRRSAGDDTDNQVIVDLRGSRRR